MANGLIELLGMPEVPYDQRHYLLFGGDSLQYEESFDTNDALDYLTQVGVVGGSLTQARTKRYQSGLYGLWREPGERQCDFCGRVLSGAEYEVLKDGRDRCKLCSDTVVHGKANFEALFHQVREGLCEKYGIDLPAQMTVKVVSTAKLASMVGKPFVPSKYYDPRTVGLATNRKGKYGVVFENGAPRLSLIATTAHELTHIWQYSHWNEAAIDAKYGEYSLAIYEGMAKWSEIQYLYLMNESEQADRELANEVLRDDVYGFGLRLFLNQYPLSKGIVLEGDTPFMHVDEPLSL